MSSQLSVLTVIRRDDTNLKKSMILEARGG